jgi:hypothetical protein
MRPDADSSDSYDSRDDSYDSRERPLPPNKSLALGVVAVCFAVFSFVGLLGGYGCVYGAEGFVRGASQGQALILFPILLILFILCGLVSVAAAFIGIVVGVISLFEGRGSRLLGSTALVTSLVWAGGVWWLVNWILQMK